jgi:hypothetical protein
MYWQCHADGRYTIFLVCVLLHFSAQEISHILAIVAGSGKFVLQLPVSPVQ